MKEKADSMICFIKEIQDEPSVITKFDPVIWNTMLEQAVVNKDSSITFKFKNGVEKTIKMKKDKKVLASLYDVKAFTNADCSEFSMTFYFKENEYFTNSKLCKKYIIDTKRERVIKSEFDEINWKSESVFTI